MSPSTVSDLNKKIYRTNEDWRNRPFEGEYPHIYLDGIMLKRSWAGEVPTSRCWSRSASTKTVKEDKAGGTPFSSISKNAA